ncbi:hypothetical protein [Paracoccus laeviglucosivorans]|uniref:hypothetical protein n=1 Tax=Paracoccus laeviglucosivorans TaxID=1197861 RepID=UPI001156E9D7|nr:hypothetical protein [Paracoccus laeviglucosivorans]
MGDIQFGYSGNLTVGKTGHIESTGDYGLGVRFQGGAKIENFGFIKGNQGLLVGDIDWEPNQDSTRIYNYGEIRAEGSVLGNRSRHRTFHLSS